MIDDSKEFRFSSLIIDEEELYKMNNYYNNIVDDYLKCFLKENDQLISQYLMRKLREENKFLKELITRVYEEFKINNISTATEQQIIHMDQNIHKEEKRRLEKHIEYLKIKLNQRDEAIEEAIKFINDDSNYFEDGENWDNVKKIRSILTKYKGDNNE